VEGLERPGAAFEVRADERLVGEVLERDRTAWLVHGVRVRVDHGRSTENCSSVRLKALQYVPIKCRKWPPDSSLEDWRRVVAGSWIGCRRGPWRRPRRGAGPCPASADGDRPALEPDQHPALREPLVERLLGRRDALPGRQG